MEVQEEEKPPIFNSWKGWYLLVIGFLFIQIVIYFFITRSFS